jgi:hypothetical protein
MSKEIVMLTETPPPYFPQGSLTPSDENRYRKFKLMVAAVVLFLLALIGGLIAGVFYFIKWILH